MLRNVWAASTGSAEYQRRVLPLYAQRISSVLKDAGNERGKESVLTFVALTPTGIPSAALQCFRLPVSNSEQPPGSELDKLTAYSNKPLTSPQGAREDNLMLRLFVGNIPNACTEIELREWFEQHGHDVGVAQIMRDRITGHSRGFGFVELRDTSNLEETVGQLHGQSLSGRVLTINAATPRIPRTDGVYSQPAS